MKNIILFTLFFYLGTFNIAHAQKTADDLEEQERPITIVTNHQVPFSPSNIYGRSTSAIPAPTVVGDNLCGSGTANLTATALSGGTLDWYNVASGGTSIGTGTVLNPVVTSTTNFWVEEVLGGGGAPTTLATPYNTNNGQRGAMFDITATNTITITSFDASLYSGTTANYEIYYRTSTHIGFQNSAAGWTLLGSATGVTSAGANIPTPLPIPFSVTIPAGQTYAFYVTNDFGGGTSYTDGTAVGNVWASNADLTLYEGVGKSYPFGLTFTVRSFNGTVHYSTGGGSTISPRSLVTASVKAPVYATTSTTTTSNASCIVNESGVDWTYYYNTANPDNLLFAIAHDPNNLGINNFTVNAAITVNTNSTTTGYYTQSNVGQQLARFVMGRYWNVNIISGIVVEPVWVRYYYKPAEKTAILNAATTWQGTNGGTVSPMYFFKTDGVPFDPTTSLNPSGVYNSLELTNYTDNQTSLNGTNYVEIHDVTSFSGGSLISGVVPVGGSTSGSAILLDLNLLEFTAKKDQQSAILKWTTEAEKAISYFVVERSLDGISFDKIGQVTPLNGEEQNHYQWTDQVPYQTINYYRLKMVDEKGDFSYSMTRAISFATGDAIWSIQPNPVTDKLTINLDNTSTSQEVQLVVWNGLGQVVYQQQNILMEGINAFLLDSSSWEKGMYVVGVKGQTLFLQQKIIKN